MFHVNHKNYNEYGNNSKAQWKDKCSEVKEKFYSGLAVGFFEKTVLPLSNHRSQHSVEMTVVEICV